jgi:hypothetical protein
MAERQCEKCGEMVDSARAFCPSCGGPLVEEEKREQQSNYEKMDKTVQMGNTMYGQMLSDMGLNISKPQPEKRVETIAPIGGSPKQERQSPAAPRQETLKPAAASSSAQTAAAKPTVQPPAPISKRKSYIVWALIAGGLLVIGLLAVIIIGVILYFYLPRLR